MNNAAKQFYDRKWNTFTIQDRLLSNDVLSLFQDEEKNLRFRIARGASQDFGE